MPIALKNGFAYGYEKFKADGGVGWLRRYIRTVEAHELCAWTLIGPDVTLRGAGLALHCMLKQASRWRNSAGVVVPKEPGQALSCGTRPHHRY